MATIEKFENLEVWKLSREVTNKIYALSKEGDFSRYFALTDQIRRSAISIFSNIAEGFESGNDKQFARYLRIAKGSAGECRAQLYVAKDQLYISDSDFKHLKGKLNICSRKLSRLIDYLSTNKISEVVIHYDTNSNEAK